MALNAYIRLIRPHQYVKNLFIFLPLVFSQRLMEPGLFLLAAGAFGVFCLASSGSYVFNDLRDVAEDREHPSKRNRPIASGEVAPARAYTLVVALWALAAAGAYMLGSDLP